MVKIINIVFFISAIIMAFAGCTKEAGVGGSASISGKMLVRDFNSLGTFMGEYDAQNYKVYLIYGNDGGAYDDDVNTSHDGSFEFKYLQKGEYELFVYSDYSYCLSCGQLGDSVVSVKFQITEKKQVLELSNITVLK
jgi:hypothetical protein